MTQPIVAARLTVLARDFDLEAGRHIDTDTRTSIKSAAATLRLVALLVTERTYTDTEGYVWLHAGRRILTTTQTQRIHA